MDIFGKDFGGMTFKDIDLSDFVFHSCNFDKSVFENVTFRSGMFVGCSLEDVCIIPLRKI